MTKVQVFCFLACYCVAFALELARTLGKSRLHRPVILGFGAAGFFAHTYYLFNRFQQTQLPPLLSSMQDWLLVLAWMLVLFYLFLAIVRPDLPLGAFALPVVLLLIASTYLMRQPTHDLLDAQRGMKMLHASLLVFGMGCVVAGFVAGLMYLVQHSRLKTRNPKRSGWTMPNLERLAQFNRWSVMLAFPLLTLGFATGVFLVLKVGDPNRHVSFNDPTVIGSGVLWVLLAAVFIRLLRVRSSSGKQVAWLTICGCGFVLLAILGLQIISGSHFPENPAVSAVGFAERPGGVS